MAAQSKPMRPGPAAASALTTARAVVAQLTQHYLAHRTQVSRAVYLTLIVALIHRVRAAVAEQKAASQRERAARAEQGGTSKALGAEGGADEDDDDAAVASSSGGSKGKKKRKKVELNREFFRSLLKLVRICVPGWRSKETRLLISHSFFLVVRTLISLKVAAMDGAIVKSLVKGNGKEFLKRIVWWMLIAVPATFTNSMVRIMVSLDLFLASLNANRTG